MNRVDRRKRRVSIALGGVVAVAVGLLFAYALALGVYAVASTRGPIAAPPADEDGARALVEALGLSAEYPFAHRFAATPQGRMHYAEAGRGAPILCLHGNLTWSYLYRDWLQGLSGSGRVIAPDLIGFGLSEKLGTAEAYTLEGHVENIATLIETLDLTDITLVLHDWGGPIGLGAALHHPTRVRRLVLMNTWPSPEAQPTGPLWRVARLPLAGEQAIQGLGLFTRVSLPSELPRDRARSEAALRAYRAVQGSWRDRAGSLAFARSFPWESEVSRATLFTKMGAYLSEFDGPALVVWGLRDRSLAPSVLDAWRAALPQAEIIALEDAGRFPSEDEPERVVSRVRAFVTTAATN